MFQLIGSTERGATELADNYDATGNINYNYNVGGKRAVAGSAIDSDSHSDGNISVARWI